MVDATGETYKQTAFDLSASHEPPKSGDLVDWAIANGVLKEEQVPLLEGVGNNKWQGVNGFSFAKSTAGLLIEGQWMSGEMVTMVPIGLQPINDSDTPEGWQLLFVPLPRGTRRLLIPDFDIGHLKALKVALPVAEWPKDQLVEVIELIRDSRKRIVDPANNPYRDAADMWNQYLRTPGGRKIPQKVQTAILNTKSEQQQVLHNYSNIKIYQRT